MRSNKNQAAKKNSNQPLLFEFNFDEIQKGFTSGSLPSFAAQSKTRVKEAEVAATKPLNDNQPQQPMHLMPWGEEALGF